MLHHRCLSLGLPLIAALACAPASGAPPATGPLSNVTFHTVPATARNGELLQRLTSPLQAQSIAAALGNQPAALNASPIDPRQQHFALYVPPKPPPAAGYALLVFVPPWKGARIPNDWIPVLNRTHTIFITAADSGNNSDVLNRRDPLALLAAAGVMHHYPVNPQQVFVGGFSGGSRVALRLALGYPDVFRGALLDAGSDPIGTAAVPLPPADLLHQFQAASRIVFLTGDADAIHQMQLAHADGALRRWCVVNTRSITLLDTPHVLASAAAIAEALVWLQQPSHANAKRLATCRAARQAQLAASLADLHAHLATGDEQRAMRSLRYIDAEYGNLAAPTLVQDLHTINALRARPTAPRH